MRLPRSPKVGSANPWYDFAVDGVVKGLNTGVRAALEAMSGGMIDAGSAKCEPGYQGASLLAGAGSALFSVIGVGQGVMAVELDRLQNRASGWPFDEASVLKADPELARYGVNVPLPWECV